MKKNIFPIIVFTAVSVYFICCIFLCGISNISLYNIILFLFAVPLFEEFIFRGLVQDKINNFFKRMYKKGDCGDNENVSMLFS